MNSDKCPPMFDLIAEAKELLDRQTKDVRELIIWCISLSDEERMAFQVADRFLREKQNDGL